MSFTDPGFGTMSLEELKSWLSSNDLSAANYSELLNQLTVDLPTALPGVVQSSIGGSSGSVTPPAQGSTLAWDVSQQLYVPGAPGPQPGDLISSVAASRPGAIICWGQTVTGGVALYPNLASACPQLVSGANLILPDFRGRLPLGAGTGTASGATAWTLGQQPTSGAGGEQTHLLTANESGNQAATTGDDAPDHGHHSSDGTSNIVQGGTSGAGAGVVTGGSGYVVSVTGGAVTKHQHPITAVDAVNAHNNMPPVSVVNWFIVY